MGWLKKTWAKVTGQPYFNITHRLDKNGKMTLVADCNESFLEKIRSIDIADLEDLMKNLSARSDVPYIQITPCRTKNGKVTLEIDHNKPFLDQTTELDLSELEEFKKTMATNRDAPYLRYDCAQDESGELILRADFNKKFLDDMHQITDANDEIEKAKKIKATKEQKPYFRYIAQIDPGGEIALSADYNEYFVREIDKAHAENPEYNAMMTDAQKVAFMMFDICYGIALPTLPAEKSAEDTFLEEFDRLPTLNLRQGLAKTVVDLDKRTQSNASGSISINRG